MFADYNTHQLAQMCEMKAKRMFDRTFEPELVDKLAEHIENFYARDIPKQNAGLAVNLTEKAINVQISRLINDMNQPSQLRRTKSAQKNSDKQLIADKSTLTAIDYGIKIAPELGDAAQKAKIMKEVDEMIGMETSAEGCLSPKVQAHDPT